MLEHTAGVHVIGAWRSREGARGGQLLGTGGFRELKGCCLLDGSGIHQKCGHWVGKATM